jgi:membrane associated rhomboid family serine protease
MIKKPQSAVIALITVICGFYLYELVDSGIIGTFALYRWDYFSQTHEYYRLFTTALIHDNSSTLPFHLAFNMMVLHQLGTPIEYVFGKAKFLLIFFVSLLTGSLASSYFMSWNGYSIGASGAVFGLFGAFIAAEKYLGVEAKSIYVIVGINFALGFTIGGVDWRAHLGGLIGGYLITKLLISLNASK